MKGAIAVPQSPQPLPPWERPGASQGHSWTTFHSPLQKQEDEQSLPAYCGKKVLGKGAAAPKIILLPFSKKNNSAQPLGTFRTGKMGKMEGAFLEGAKQTEL